jgi:hypothetical protein
MNAIRRSTDGFRTCPDEGDPFPRFTRPSVLLRGGGSIDPMPDGCSESSTGDSVKLSKRLGVDEHARPLVATLPNRKAGSWVSALLGRCGMLLEESPFVRVRVGLLAAGRRLPRQC